MCNDEHGMINDEGRKGKKMGWKLRKTLKGAKGEAGKEGVCLYGSL